MLKCRSEIHSIHGEGAGWQHLEGTRDTFML
jgi:hypothetical protein